MPRISGKMIRQAVAHSRMLPPLLNATRNLEQAKAELRWIQKELPASQWLSAIARRSRLEPLQYILGSQPFGPLDILCEKNVLIPRWETEEWASKIAGVVLPSLAPKHISVLDACTGSGCVPLLLKSMLPHAQISGFDFSVDAVDLSLRNKAHTGLEVDFCLQDLYTFRPSSRISRVDLVTSNPPYIPEHDYNRPLALDGPEASVRMYEPRDALVGHLEFYTALVEKVVVPLGAKGLVFELGYEDQARETAARLPRNWSCGRYIDSAEQLRCVVAWEKGSDMACLDGMVNGGYL